MSGIHLYLENGFDHDRVTVAAGEHTLAEETDVTTRYQLGLARTVELTLPNDGPVVIRIAVPARQLTAKTLLDPADTPHLRVNLLDRALAIEADADPPRYA